MKKPIIFSFVPSNNPILSNPAAILSKLVNGRHSKPTKWTPKIELDVTINVNTWQNLQIVLRFDSAVNRMWFFFGVEHFPFQKFTQTQQRGAKWCHMTACGNYRSKLRALKMCICSTNTIQKTFSFSDSYQIRPTSKSM